MSILENLKKMAIQYRLLIKAAERAENIFYYDYYTLRLKETEDEINALEGNK